MRNLIVIAGILVGQFILYWPSLIGQKILLPLDILSQPNIYLPMTEKVREPHDPIMSDMVLETEPHRRFAVSEVWAGRFPNWMPYQFAGSPCYRWSFSPVMILTYLIESPIILAWTQVIIALVAGFGAYVFFYYTLKVSFWPAALIAWCYPLTGMFIVWQGCGSPPVICWLPWILFAVDKTVRQPRSWGGPTLAVLTTVVLVSGQTDIAGQILLTSGVYAIWCMVDRGWKWTLLKPALVSIIMAWTLGIMASLWLLIPLVEYTHTGNRIVQRTHGVEERPPTGLTALPQVIVPEIWGTTLDNSFYVVPGNVPESAVGGYAGLIAALFLVPLAWTNRKRWSICILWTVLIFISMSWQLNVPIMVTILRLPLLNMMSHNRFVFVTSFAILSMAVIGLDLLWQGEVRPRLWFLLPAIILIILVFIFIVKVSSPPEPIATQLQASINMNQLIGNRLRDVDWLARIKFSYARVYFWTMLFCGAGASAWLVLVYEYKMQKGHVFTIAGLLIVELLSFARGYNTQADPSLYYPPIPILHDVANSEPGRIIGYGCLPAGLASTNGLSDIRGYDGVDPSKLIDLMRISADPRSPSFPYALTQWMIPKVMQAGSGQLYLSPILNMLNVKYIIFRGQPPKELHPSFIGADYWVMINQQALARVYVPKKVEVVANDTERLVKIAAPDFDPKTVAYVESKVDLPQKCEGSVDVIAQTPKLIVIHANMKTSGLVVLADLWDKGWKATLDDQQVPILQTNHAIRGVVVPPGNHVMMFKYEPVSMIWGLVLLILAVIIWGVWFRYTASH